MMMPEAVVEVASAAAAGLTAMPDYRIYIIEKDEHIRRPPEVIDCQGDEAALAHAEKHLDGLAVEVWELTRLGGRLNWKEH
jgi:hypothetical protein